MILVNSVSLIVQCVLYTTYPIFASIKNSPNQLKTKPEYIIIKNLCITDPYDIQRECTTQTND